MEVFQLVNNCHSITQEKSCFYNNQNLNPQEHFIFKKQNFELFLDRGESQYQHRKHMQHECCSTQKDHVLHQVNGLWIKNTF